MSNGYINKIIGGMPRGLKFNQMALVTFLKTIDFENYEQTANYAMVWAGLVANAYVKKEEFTEPFESVCDWVDELTKDDLDEIYFVFKETKVFQRAIKVTEEAGDTAKK